MLEFCLRDFGDFWLWIGFWLVIGGCVRFGFVVVIFGFVDFGDGMCLFGGDGWLYMFFWIFGFEFDVFCGIVFFEYGFC